MSACAKSLLLLMAAILFSGVSVWAQDAFVQGGRSEAPKIKITECVVYSRRDKSIHRDCTGNAEKKCDGARKCELPIGLNLTDGRDIDPVGPPMVRRIGEFVLLKFQCGSNAMIRGPVVQDNNATLILACQ